VDRPGNADSAGLGKRLQACGDIDPVAEDVAALDDDVAEVDADAKPDAPLVGHFRLAVEHAALHLGGTAHRIDDARKFGQHAVASGLDDAAAMLGDLRIDQLPAVRLEAFERAFFVGAHQARIARHIGGEDRGKTAGRVHGNSAARPPLRSTMASTFAGASIPVIAGASCQGPRATSAAAFDLLPCGGRKERRPGQATRFGRLVDCSKKPGIDRQIGLGWAPGVEQ
jgi:hypothetical protein